MEQGPLIPGVDDGKVFRSLFAAYPDALLLVGPQGVIVLANPAAVELLGYPTDELVGLSVDALVPDAIRPRHAAYRNAYANKPIARPIGVQMDLAARRKDGSEVMVEIALSPLHDQGMPYVVAAIRGVGGYPRVQRALRRVRYAEALAQIGRLAVDARDPHQLMEQVPVSAAEALQVETALILLLESTRLEFRIAAAVGLLRQEAIGDRVRNEPDSLAGYVIAQGGPVLVTDFAHERRFKVPPHYLAAGVMCELALPLSDRGRAIGILSVRSRLSTHFGEDEIRFLDSLSNLLATILQRTQSEEALSHSQRLESIGQLTGGIAHDFNNLLTVISGNLQVLEDTPAYADASTRKQLIGAATRATRRGAELTSKLLAFSRIQVLQPTTVDTSALLRSLTDMLRRTLDQRISISLDAHEVLCLVDPGQLETALLNIAINAQHAMPQGGELSFTCRAEAAPASELEAKPSQAAASDYVAISITDTGTGMPDAVKERAFEPFFTTKKDGRGTGLGLSTVYGFAKQSHGAVRLDSTLGAGTTVTIYLPRVIMEEAGAEEPRDLTVDAHIPRGLRVLLVEDDAEVQSVVRTFLVSMCCEVVSCSNGEHALEVLTSGRSLDLLLTDVALGIGMRGTDLANEARVRRSGLPVLLMSGFSSDLLEGQRGRELLRKPFTRTQLERGIARALTAVQ